MQDNYIILIELLLQFPLMIINTFLFYFSIKICFWNGKDNKTKLFFMSLFTNPYIAYLITLFLVMITISIIYIVTGYMTTFNNGINGAEGEKITIIVTLVTWFIYLIFMFIFAYLVGKLTHAHNKSLVTFIYIMFTVIFICQFKPTIRFENNYKLNIFIIITDALFQIFATFALFHFDVKALSKMTDQKNEINWKLFVITPTLLSIFFMLVSVSQAFNSTNELKITFNIFSYLLLFLFIWAFYVIIQNINATNDAIKSKDEVKTLSVEVMEALAHTIDAKDEYTRGHSVRVAQYSRMIAEKLGLSPEECENVYYMGLLHDIGKIGVPNEIINSTSKLTDEEYAVIKTHPGLGYDILAEIKSRPDLSIGARWHHERYDGKGYPDGKSGDEIPLMARIIAVADSYDAMTSNRSYRDYMPQDKVRSEIEKNIGTQFDPNIAKCMLAIIDNDVNYALHE